MLPLLQDNPKIYKTENKDTVLTEIHICQLINIDHFQESAQPAVSNILKIACPFL